VALQLGLKIDELPIIGANIGDVRVACEVLLGDIPPNKYIKGKTIYLTWILKKFQELLFDAMMLIGGCLMPNVSGERFHFMYLLLLSNFIETSPYSWGAIVLASIFRALGRAVKSL